VTPPGQGFLPADTARHHQAWALEIIRRAVDDAGIDMADVDVVAYTKGRSESGSSKISVEREDG
jgi:N6-L-threonylcarbamoyladenine synthase